LNEKFDPEAKRLITSFEPENLQIFVDEDRLQSLGLTLRDLAHYLESQPFIFAAFTNDDVRGCGARSEACDANAQAIEGRIERPNKGLTNR
jgi:hypothetical protein